MTSKQPQTPFVSYLAKSTLSRRDALRRAALTGAAVPIAAATMRPGLAGAAPASPGLQSARTQNGAPQRGGELVVSDEKAIANLDPHFESIPDPAHGLLFDRLVDHRPTGDEETPWAIQGELAEAWEFNDDGTALDFTLRRGVTFHDGSPWDASTAEWNVTRMKSELSRFRTQLEFVESAEALDEYTLRYHFFEPVGSAALLQVALTSIMVSRQAVEAEGDEGFGRNPVGTGPCRFVEWIPDDRLILERNPDYWQMGEDGEPLPYFDTVRSLHTVDLARASVELRSGNIMAYQFPPARDIPILLGDDAVEFVTVPGTYRADLARVMINMNEAPFDDINVRRAALHALDEAGFANAMGPGIMEPHHTLWWAPGVLGYDEDLRTLEYDPDRSRELLADAGVTDGVDVTLKIINRTNDRQAAQILKQLWDAVGIRTEIEGLERVTYNADLAEGNYQVAVIGTGISPDPELQAHNFTTGGPGNWGRYSNPDVDQLADDARRSNDDDERAEIYRDIQRILIDDAGLKVLARHPLGFAISTQLRDVTAMAGGGLELRFAWIEQ